VRSSADDPFVPSIGEIYLVRTEIMLLPDPKERRPAVVIERPAGPVGRVHVVTRTTDTTRKGVAHPPTPALGLQSAGVFWRYTSTEAASWTPRNCRLLGILDPLTLRRILERFT